MIALLKKDSGIAMPIVVVIIAVVTLLGFTSVVLMENQTSMEKRYEASESALSIAEAGINEYLWHLNKDSRFYATPEGDDFVNDSGDPKEHEFQSGKYTLEITEPTAADPTVKIKSTGWLKGDESSKCAVEVEVLHYRCLYFCLQHRFHQGDE
jgi:Tfp pilus assembly protein PilX